uniref:halocyanin domain-containing protein n=1 Tax=Halorussus marinus TaxID=2505976 RepID=UPI001092495F|nr:halocyanin domain-containing protein [Halorussus marinus]
MSDTTRRDFLKGAATATAATVGAGAAAGGATAQSDADLSAWFEDVGNYDGVVDETGSDEVTISVGAQGNGGGFAFGPAAVRVDPGTTVVWEWTGDGGSHNVVAENGDFESELTDETGHTFEHTPEESGIVTYACSPHKTMGMKGALVVGDVEIGGASESGGLLGSVLGDPWTAAAGGSILLGLLSPIAFAALLFGRDPDRPTPK